MHMFLQKQNRPNALSIRRFRIAIGASFLVLIGATILAWSGALPAWERQLFVDLNSWQGGEVITTIAKILSDAVWAVAFLVAILLVIPRCRRVAWQVAVPAVTTYVIVFLTEIIVGRARPDVLLSGDVALRAQQDGMGFPSGHAAVIMAVVVALWLRMTAVWRVVALCGVLLVGWSRVYLGVHFPLDIVAGFTVGIIVASIFQIIPLAWLYRLRLAEKKTEAHEL